MVWCSVWFGRAKISGPSKSKHSFCRLFVYTTGSTLMHIINQIEIWELNTLLRSQAQGIFCWSPKEKHLLLHSSQVLEKSLAGSYCSFVAQETHITVMLLAELDQRCGSRVWAPYTLRQFCWVQSRGRDEIIYPTEKCTSHYVQLVFKNHGIHPTTVGKRNWCA